MSAKKNPLYVVTDNGNVVEEATGFMDAMIKKFGLEPVLEIVNTLLSMLTGQVGNYGFFLYLQELIDNFAKFVEGVVEKVNMFIPSNS